MSDLSSLAVGDAIVVHDPQARYAHRKVAKVGRVWLTDDRGDKFRIDGGQGEERHQFGHGFYALTVPEWEEATETARLRERLTGWGWTGVRRKSLTLDQMRRAAALLAEFESENAGGRREHLRGDGQFPAQPQQPGAGRVEGPC